ncbi:class I SAM-dependent methyltransferase [Flavobacterium wongokense]|uniref:class I SAM-dependent methyltransferase n=1 Tax=Flavobacterium wongokense TaxID=2910674 RepID=UPI001F375E86|nr:methyltransferase domain-containing protein [Flavobacterium sp. WG47]MCF6131632.1 class I SAM-dependent methyltransferase [Flavobacterium sp. WG47]
MKQNQEHTNQKNISYYDKIAAAYDTILKHEVKNDLVRKKVAQQFISQVKEGLVLDFGGGTGEDLKWLSANNYSVIFCEPSSGMRGIAMEKFPNSGITFLKEEQTDFTKWNQTLPFQQKVSGVIANFAVLNCIVDIELLFENMALVMAPKADLFFLVLDYGLKKRIQMLFEAKPMKLKIEYQGEDQQVYLHSVTAIRKASKANFEFICCERLREHGFSLIHLKRK